jgi:hypothetical protein
MTRSIRATLALAALLPLALLAGCGDDGGGAADAGLDAGTDTDSDADAGPDGGSAVPLYDFAAAAPWYQCPESLPEGVEIVTVFDRADQYFGDEDLRTIQSVVDFPAETGWAQVGLWFELECPADGDCDNWDRAGYVQLVLNPEEDPAEWQQVELARQVTPYNMGMCEYIDVTPLADLLTGERTLTSFIDTWVGPGNSNGHGWRVTVKLVFYPGSDATPEEAVNIWGSRSITVGEVDAGATVDDQVDPVLVGVPLGTSQVLAHLTTTGHSFGNTGNCAEFCQMRQDLYVNGTLFSVNPWRDDCEENPVSPQGGTWQYDRNGWCPGAIAVGQLVDVTEAIDPGVDNEFDFDIRLADGDEYVNTSPVDWLPNEIVALRLYLYE